MEWRKEYTQEGYWPRINQVYRHNYNDRVPHFNLIFMLGQTLLPNLVYQVPGVINTPNRPNMIQWASLWDSIDNWWVHQAELKDIAQEAVLDAYLHNLSAAFIGYDFGSSVQQDMQEVAGSIDRSRRENIPWVDLVPSHRALFAPGTKQIRNCPWAAKFVTTPTRVLKGRKGLGNCRPSPIPSSIMSHEQDLWRHRSSEDITAFWEIHDAETGKWAWLSTNGNFIMPWDDDPLQVDGLPVDVLTLNKNRESIWGTADPIYIMTQHLEGDDVRHQGLKQRRLSVPKFAYDSNAIDSSALDSLLSANAPPGIPVDVEGDRKIQDFIMEFTTPVNYGLMDYAKQLLNDAQLVLGVGPNQLGTFAPGRRSATEANIVEGVSNSRVGNRRESVGKFLEGMVRKANKLMVENWNGDIVKQVVGVDGAMYWVKANPKELQESGFGVTASVNVESLAPVSRERRKREAADLLGMLSTMTESGANPMPILKQFLAQFEWVDVTQVLPQVSGDPMGMDQFMQQQQGLMEAGGVGPQAASNVQGVQSLLQKLPSEGSTTTGERNVRE
jgi:hypothetical protein